MRRSDAPPIRTAQNQVPGTGTKRCRCRCCFLGRHLRWAREDADGRQPTHALTLSHGDGDSVVTTLCFARAQRVESSSDREQVFADRGVRASGAGEPEMLLRICGDLLVDAKVNVGRVACASLGATACGAECQPTLGL